MAEVLVQFTDPVVADGVAYLARACGGPAADGLWQGWIEFSPIDGDPTLRSRRETTQPNREDTLYWATGLSVVYLEGALRRTLNANRAPAPLLSAPKPAFDEPAPAASGRMRSVDAGEALGHTDAPHTKRPADAILDPVAVYRKGEQLLRQQLGALSAWHLVNIIEAHGLSGAEPAQLNAMTEPALIELIVRAVERRESPREVDPQPRRSQRGRKSTRATTPARR